MNVFRYCLKLETPQHILQLYSMRTVRPPPRVVPPKHLFEPSFEDHQPPPSYPPPEDSRPRPASNYNNRENDFDRDVREQMKILEDNIKGMISENPSSFDVFNYSSASNNKSDDLFANMAQQQKEESLQPRLFMYSSEAQQPYGKPVSNVNRSQPPLQDEHRSVQRQYDKPSGGQVGK
jgi:hypothetical protein